MSAAGAPDVLTLPLERHLKTFPSVSASRYSPHNAPVSAGDVSGCPSCWECAPLRSLHGAAVVLLVELSER
ncbi:hypothetical protein NQZ68_028170 [Dissostichus eleginoides]|nr:hypothetical protein NQZ68_028170 [Dissostichus eleginoides]